MNCSVTNNQDNLLSVECDSLRCKNCVVVFELHDKESNNSEFTEFVSDNQIVFNHSFSQLNCSEYELNAFIRNENFTPIFGDKILIEQDIGKP